MEWSSPHFLEFLRMLRQDKHIETIYIIGHSMGSRLITSALAALDSSQSNSKFKDVILAAPDVDLGVFKHTADPLSQHADRVTIYESSTDLALTVSHEFHDYPRLGDTRPNVNVFRHYDCIEATAVDTSILGHSYISDSPSILADIFDLIVTQLPPQRRFRLDLRSYEGLPYWSFRK